MKLKSILAAATAASSLVATGVRAEVINFDDISAPFSDLGPSYHGLTWTDWEVFNGADFYNNVIDPDTGGIEGPNGYTNGVVSGPNVACGCAADFGDVTNIITGSNITLTSGYFTSAWNDGETLTVDGLSKGVVVDTVSFTINTSGPTLELFGWSGLDEIDFTPTGGTNVGFNGQGEYFALDNLNISGGVPEPATWAVMLLGFAGLGVAMRSRRRPVAATA